MPSDPRQAVPAAHPVWAVAAPDCRIVQLLAETPDITHVPIAGRTGAHGPHRGQISDVLSFLTRQVLELIVQNAASSRCAMPFESSLRRAPTVGEMGFASLKAPCLWGILATARTPSAIVEQIAQDTRTPWPEQAYQHFSIDGCFEPTSIRTPTKSGVLEERPCPVDHGRQSAWIEDRLNHLISRYAAPCYPRNSAGRCRRWVNRGRFDDVRVMSAFPRSRPNCGHRGRSVSCHKLTFQPSKRPLMLFMREGQA